MPRVSVSTMKILFAVSCNTCAYPRCEERLTDPSWKQVNADIAHIHGEKPDAARYNAALTDVHGYDNLLLLCPNHHRLIDALDPDGHPPERLKAMKAKHEEACRNATWASDADLERYAELVLDLEMGVQEFNPRLVAEKNGNAVEVVNVGVVDALDCSVKPIGGSDNWFLPHGGPLERLPPGGRWTAGVLGISMAEPTGLAVRVEWRSEGGSSLAANFPVD